jgi:deoxyribose-phosphate aldolase
LKHQLHYTSLQPNTSVQHIQWVCKQAIQLQLPQICVPPLFVKKTVEFIQQTTIAISTVIGYPYGFSAIEAKIAEVVLAIIDGAHILELCINIGALKSNDWQYLANELQHVLQLINSKNKKLTILLPYNLLSKQELMQCCDLYGIAGIHAVKLFSTDDNEAILPEIVQTVKQYLTASVKIEVLSNTKNDTFVQVLLQHGASAISSAYCTEILNTYTIKK